MTSSSGPFPGDQQITSRWGVTFTPWHDPGGRVGFRADRDGLTILAYLTLPADPGNGQDLAIDACTRPGDDTGEHDLDTHTATVPLGIIGPATAHPWTDGFSVGWRIEGLHHTRYTYMTPSVDGTWGEDTADVYVYVSDSADPRDAGSVLWLPVHERTAEPLIAAGPVTGPGLTFDPAEFADWFRTPDTRQALPGLVTTTYDSGDLDDSAAFRADMLIANMPATVWQPGAGVSDLAIWATTGLEGNPAGDGGAVVTFRLSGLELSAGHLAADELIRRVHIDASGIITATALHAAIQVLTAIAERVNDTVRHFVHVTDQAGADGTWPDAAATLDNTADGATHLPARGGPATEPANAGRDDDIPGGVPISLVTGWTTATIHVDPELEDAVVFVTAGDPAGYPIDLVGIDFNAGTVGVWTGPDPDSQEWTVVHHVDVAQVRAQGQPPTGPEPS